MAKLELVGGTTGKAVDIFVQNNTSTKGAGLTGLVFNSANLQAYYYREGANATVAIPLVTATLGTWASGGFVAIDGTNMPGMYQLGLPNAALAAGAKSVKVYLWEITTTALNIAPCVLEIELTATDNQTAAVTLPANPPAAFLVAASYGTAPAWYGDPWATAEPGSYSATTFGGFIVAKLGLITSLTVAGSSAPTGTVISALSAYATSADMIARFDSNVLCQLVSDTGTRVAVGTLSTNTYMTAALMAASGLVEAECLRGERYFPADLTSLATTNAGALLADITCGLAMDWLYNRRIDIEKTESTILKNALGYLKKLGDGDMIFGLAAAASAGHASHAIETSSEVLTRNDVPTQAQRVFGTRTNRLQ